MVKSIRALLAEGKPVRGMTTNPKYGRVFFSLRQYFHLTASECLLADVISILSRKSGWCFASREYLANLLGISTRTLQRMLARLKERELVEQHPHDTRRLRPTDLWKEACDSTTR